MQGVIQALAGKLTWLQAGRSAESFAEFRPSDCRLLEAQNAFGVMLRRTYACSVDADGKVLQGRLAE
jgi:hypothetical protein